MWSSLNNANDSDDMLQVIPELTKNIKKGEEFVLGKWLRFLVHRRVWAGNYIARSLLH